MTATPTADELFAEASGWYFRLQAEDVTAAEMDAFAAWLGQGSAQDEAWQEVQAMLGGLREPARVIRRAEQAAKGCAPGQTVMETLVEHAALPQVRSRRRRSSIPDRSPSPTARCHGPIRTVSSRQSAKRHRTSGGN